MNTQPSTPLERAREQNRDRVTEAYERWQQARTLVVRSSFELTALFPGEFPELEAAQRAATMARTEFDRLFAARMAESTGGVE